MKRALALLAALPLALFGCSLIIEAELSGKSNEGGGGQGGAISGTSTSSTSTSSTSTSSTSGSMCIAPMDDCNHSAMDGCETDTSSDVDHCGGCNKPCNTNHVANVSCVDSMCVIDGCSMGFGNCDKKAETGCETNTKTSEAHCGGCDMPCNANQQCVAGMCKF